MSKFFPQSFEQFSLPPILKKNSRGIAIGILRLMILLVVMGEPVLAQPSEKDHLNWIATEKLVSGPMLGQVSLRTAKVWFQVGTTVKRAEIRWWPAGENDAAQSKLLPIPSIREFRPVQTELGGLEPGKSYQYSIVLDGKSTGTYTFSTVPLWQYRTPAPDFSFLTGSCAYFNEPQYDRPGKPYGGDSSIFQTMASEKAAFMLWLGDNWYTRDADYFSEWGLWYRASRDRSMRILQPFWQAMPHYAAWDDHDFGPNDIGKNYIYRDSSRAVFQSYWANPSCGQEGKGVYTQFSYSDVDFFLLDDRFFRSNDRLPAVVNGAINEEKEMLGAQQLEWLKNALAYSNATFKIIVLGSQVLNPGSPFDKLLDFPKDYHQLTGFIETMNIKGVVFLSGDRHHSEIIKVNRKGTYPLYDITCSPLTSGTHQFSGMEKENPWRIFGLDEKQNYGRISISGEKGKRRLKVEFLGIKGEKLGEWSVLETELR